MRNLNIVVAKNNNQAIGKDNKLLWHLPEDLKRFKKLTLNHVIIMGRKTHESIGKPLPKRINVVLSKQHFYYPKVGKYPVVVSPSFDEALAFCLAKYPSKKIFIIGGEAIYKQALPFCSKIYLTNVDDNQQGDAHFPELDDNEWAVVEKNPKEGYEFLTLERTKT